MNILKSISVDGKKNRVKTKQMSEMQPLEICVIASGDNKGDIVMRTASTFGFEVINLSDLRSDNFYNEDDYFYKVMPFEGKSITLYFE